MVRAPRYRYEDPIDRWRRSLIWQAPERIDDASDFYRRDLAGGDDEITLEDIERPPVFERRIDQRPLRPKDIPNDMLGRNPFQQAEFTPGMQAGLSSSEYSNKMRGRPYWDWSKGRTEDEDLPILGPPPERVPPRPPSSFDPNAPLSSLDGPPNPWAAYGGTQLASLSPSSEVVPPSPPQQDTQSVADVFGSPQSGATAMARRNKTPAEQDRDRVLERIRSGELDRETGQRLLQDANQRLYDQNIDPHTGGPFLTPEDEAGLQQRQQERELVPASQRIFPPGTGISLPEELTPEERANLDYPPTANEDMWTGAARRRTFDNPYADFEARRGAALGGLPQEGPPNPLANIRGPNPNVGDPYTPPSQRGPNPIPGDPYTPPAGPPSPLAAEFANLRNGPRDLTPGLRAGGQEARLPIPRPETGFTMLPNGPREWSLGIQTPGGQQSRLPQNRPALPTDAPGAGPPPPVPPDLISERIAGADQSLQAEAARQNLRDAAQRANAPPAPPNPMLARPNLAVGIPKNPLGSTDLDPMGLTRPPGFMLSGQAPSPPVDPAAIEEARRTLQLHPDTGRIRTAPGLTQFNEPARTAPGPQLPPGIRDLEAERNSPEVRARVAAEASQIARLPRPRPAEQFGPPVPMEAIGSDVPGPQSSLGLPDTAMASIRASYDPRASGGPAEDAAGSRGIAPSTTAAQDNPDRYKGSAAGHNRQPWQGRCRAGICRGGGFDCRPGSRSDQRGRAAASSSHSRAADHRWTEHWP